MRALLDLYRAQFRITFATQLQYRAELLIWLIGMILEPVIYLVVWSAVSASKGTVDGFSRGDFAAYFIVTMMVNFITFDWHMWEFEFRIRDGQFSPLLLRPVHPIHADMASNITYKTLMLIIMLPVSALLAYVFDANIQTNRTAIGLFLVALFLAFVLRSILEWSLALLSFWTTRMLAVNRTYFSLNLFLSGKMAPITLLPAALQAAAFYLPFRWMVYFPAEVLLGRVAPDAALHGFVIQIAWIGACLLLLNLMWRFGVRRYAGVGA
jgi:ABC-2 type transport system permease protein